MRVMEVVGWLRTIQESEGTYWYLIYEYGTFMGVT